MKKLNNAFSRYKSFFIKLLAFFALIFIADFTIGLVLRYYYFKQQNGLLYRTTYSMEQTKADVLVFGSSRANHHYSTEIFEKELNLSYYNAGRDGNFIFYHYAVLKAALKRYKPKMVILDFSNGELGVNAASYDRISSLLPYYKTHPEIREIVELRSPFEKYKLVSKIYPFNSLTFTIAVGNATFNKDRTENIQGFVPLYKTWPGTAVVTNYATQYEIDSTKLNIFKSFINDCNINNIKLYIVCSPVLQKSATTDYSVALAKEIAKNNNVPFFDFSLDKEFNTNNLLFADVLHLNNNGAKLFSIKLIDSIKSKDLSIVGKTDSK